MRPIYLFALFIIFTGCKQASDSTSETTKINTKKEASVENINEPAWVLKTSIDLITDKNTKEAFITNKDNNILTIIRRNDNSVWGYIQLAGFEQFGVSDKLIFRVDKNEPVEFNDKLEKISEKYGEKIQSWEWNPNLIGFRMWHGSVEEGCGYIQQLYHGKELVVRYHPNKSTQKDIFFSIEKNHDAILNSIDLEIYLCAKR
ncbi:MAG: hypothetical protein ACWA6Y_00835 [Polaromonas sp.]